MNRRILISTVAGLAAFLLFITWIADFNFSRTLAGETESDLIGTKAQDWQVKDWLNAESINLKDLKGKAVLVRWWMAGCPFCLATAPSLNEFYDQFHSQGLEVVGFYHHKSSTPLDVASIHAYAKKLGFRFPVAIDYDWRTLKKWWLDNSKGNYTSVSFLLDGEGIIRYIHPGGQYVKGDADYQAIRRKIEELLVENERSKRVG